MTINSALPAACGVAFKEWAGMCEVLAQGRQSIILRKGGIAEGSGGFTPEHSIFWLYPTHLHEVQQGLRSDVAIRPSWACSEPTIPIQLLAAVESVAWIDSTDVLQALESFHIWTPATVLQRFHYRQPGLWVLAVRIYTRSLPTLIPVTPEQAGCKTWVSFEPAVATFGLDPVLDEAEAARRRERLAAALHATR